MTARKTAIWTLTRIHNLTRKTTCRQLSQTKGLVSGGKCYIRAANRKNVEPYFNLVKDDVIDSSEHTITLDKHLILLKSDLAFKGNFPPGPKKTATNQPPIGHNLIVPSSLAGKRKQSPPKKTFGRDQTQLKRAFQGQIRLHSFLERRQTQQLHTIFRETPQILLIFKLKILRWNNRRRLRRYDK